MASIWKHFKEGGWGMWPILFWSVCVFGIIIERALYLSAARITKDAFLSTMEKAILAGDVQAAVKKCSATQAPMAKIVQAGLLRTNRPDEEVQAAMDEAALRELPKLSARTGFLALLANLAMLSGLLGTVSGLISSFGAVSGESVDPSQKARILAEGISEAMNCTASVSSSRSSRSSASRSSTASRSRSRTTSTRRPSVFSTSSLRTARRSTRRTSRPDRPRESPAEHLRRHRWLALT